MKRSFLQIGVIAAAAILGTTSAMAIEGDTGSSADGSIQAKVVKAQNPYAADVANYYGVERIS